MDAVTAIMNDHRTLERLLASLSTDGSRHLLVEVAARLRAHCVAEEAHAYRALVNEDPRERPCVYRAVREHRTVARKLATAARCAGTPGFDAARQDFIDIVNKHIADAESLILPALRERTSAAWREELGRLFEQRRTAELAARGVRPS